MENETADPSVEAMAPEMHRAEDPLEAAHPPPAVSTANMSTTETLPPKEFAESAPTVDTQMAEGPMVNPEDQTVTEAFAERIHGPGKALPEASLPQDSTLAMENNPVTTAETGIFKAYDNTADQETIKSSSKSESSATAWTMHTPAKTASKISFDEFLTLSEITFEWSDSYDDKDWRRLRAILAPTLMVDYTEVNGHKWDAMTAEDFVGIMSHIGFVGDPLVHTQHHIGASKWQKISDEEVIGYHQLRAAHQRYTSLDLKTVETKGHGHAMVKHLYKKINGEWKLAGLRPALHFLSIQQTKCSNEPRHHFIMASGAYNDVLQYGQGA